MRADIANMALAHLGQSPAVVSLVPPSGGGHAAACAQLYPSARAQLLASHAWGFALRRVAMVQSDQPAGGGWAFALALPSDTLRLVGVLASADSDARVEYDTGAAGTVLTSTPSAAALIVSGNVQDGTLPPLVVDAFARGLAYLLSGPVLKADGGLRSALYSQYQTALREAVNADCAAYRPQPAAYLPASLRARG